MKKTVLTAVVLVILVSCQQATDNYINNQMDEAATSLASETIEAYEIAYRNEDWQNAYGEASLAASFFLEAGDEDAYIEWRGKAKKLEQKMLQEMGM